ncbi:hypothetical protein K504DRAFT_432112 [Pleomassaria siparia CBS 279.74]|uniref:Calcium-dependent phosphotriesterase n=1 Tax=Pleomassaria siparia CBS 279.74 TaxID=1314801 RepID=A0A6G1KAN4_9PLEO|nr:hypothetical protein K504DRAFT_432112 [Pleomassaria siparia CBS 279.74]
MARSSIYLLILAMITPWLYDRYQAMSCMLKNRPGSLQPIYNIKQHKMKFRDQIRNCEDILLDEGMGVAFLSCDPGRDRWNTVMGSFHPEGLQNGAIWIYDYTTPDLPDSAAIKPLQLENFDSGDFHPLGMELESSTSTLYVANHAQSGTVIEVFSVSVKSMTATHVITLKHPLIHTPNSIHSLGGGKFFFTNDHYMRAAVSPLLSKIETWSGAPGGSVVFFDINKPETAKTVARVPFANGIVMLNATTLVVASSSKTAVYFFDVAPDYNLTSKGFVRVPAGVDNLSVDSKGALLMAGHPFAPGLFALSQRRWKCDPKSAKEVERKACECEAPSWAAEWTEKDGLRELYKGFDICSSCTAVRDVSRGFGIITGLYDKGFMVFQE